MFQGIRTEFFKTHTASLGMALLSCALLASPATRADNPVNASSQAPDFARLGQSAYLMGPGNSTNKISDNWLKQVTFMKEVPNFDDIAKRIEGIVCGEDQNKSVLIIGEPSLAYVYLFARLAGPRPDSLCGSDMWHAEVNVSKIESGHKFVGEVDEYWNNYVLAPADRRNVVLYFTSLTSLIGIGSHSHDETGIEREYVANFTSGRIRTVAFIDKFQYNELARSSNSYVVEAFADKIVLPPLDSSTASFLAATYLRVLYPALKVAPTDFNFIVKNTAFYMPNRQEPDRTMSVVNALVRAAGKTQQSKPESININIESKHPYDKNTREEYNIEQNNFDLLTLEFEQFDFENGYDFLEIRDAKNGNNLLQRLTGSMIPGTKVGPFPTSHLKLLLISDPSGGDNKGFKINRIYGSKVIPHFFTHEEVRRAVLEVAQVPNWLIERDFNVIRNLQGKLDGDVVGVAEGKRDLVRLAKNGYVAGRTDDKPVATVLLAGPTGTGKSYIAKKMADFMGMKLVTMDMTSYKEPSSFKIFQETLARHLTNTPYAVYLFEEIDKAAMEVLDQLYFMMDEGLFYDSFQRPLFARGAFILMTTNAASDVILKNPNDPQLRKYVMEDLKKHFRMSFINRFDAISLFKPFTDAEYFQLAKTMVDKKIQRIKENFNWTATTDIGVIQFISNYGKSPEFGARPMERLVESTLGIGIAEYQLNREVIPENTVLAFNKLPEPFQFQISVGTDTLIYQVDPTGNLLLQNISPLMRTAPGRKLQKFFESIRMYND